MKPFLLCLMAAAYALISVQMVKDYPQKKEMGLMRHISQLTPPFDYLWDLSQGRQEPNPLEIDRFVSYYTYLESHHFSSHEIKEVLAFCYYHLNRKDQAIRLYQESSQEDGAFFWSRYNLAVCYLSQKKFHDAKSALESLTNTSLDLSLKHLLTSQVYGQYIGTLKISPEELANDLGLGRQKAYICLQALNTYESTPDPAVKENILRQLTQAVQPTLL